MLLNENQPMFSIIVPVYNVERYLKNCIESVVGQEFKDFELLLIDNGSTDNSYEICENYSKKYGLVKTYLQEYPGVSATRNFGLEHARGKYVMFLDSDDYLVSDTLQQINMILTTNHVDLLYFNFFLLKNKKTTIYPLSEDLLTSGNLSMHAAIKSSFITNGYGGYAWNKVYKRSFLKEIRFNTSINYLEDLLFNIEVIEQKPIIYHIKTPLYVYRQRNSSISHIPYSKEKLTYLDALDLLQKKLPSDYASLVVPRRKIAEIDFASKVKKNDFTQYKQLKKRFLIAINQRAEDRTSFTAFLKLILKSSDLSFDLAVEIFMLHDFVKKIMQKKTNLKKY